jgi:mRNA interferase RelE/StbE
MGENSGGRMSREVRLIPEAVNDYKALDGSLKKLVNDKIDKLREGALAGEPLGNKNNIDLTGFYKIYFAKKKYRIIYRIVNETIEIVEIWGIGKRENLEIYRIVGKRL